MAALSAGLLLYRRRGRFGAEVLLVHPGGPFWARKDEHAWSIPKGEVEPGEDPENVAAREFREELGQPVPPGEWLELGEIRQKSGKRVVAWAVEGDVDENAIKSNTFDMEWPRGSGDLKTFPEVDRAAWLSVDEATVKLVSGQIVLVERLCERLDSA